MNDAKFKGLDLIFNKKLDLNSNDIIIYNINSISQNHIHYGLNMCLLFHKLANMNNNIWFEKEEIEYFENYLRRYLNDNIFMYI